MANVHEFYVVLDTLPQDQTVEDLIAQIAALFPEDTVIAAGYHPDPK